LKVARCNLVKVVHHRCTRWTASRCWCNYSTMGWVYCTLTR